ncbi:MAG: class C sortase [Acutalibacteraceae bacterium]|nr:class C sortase [Acutalibacteraceae bacterium]
MKRSLAIFGVILIFLAGVGIMAYPMISSFVNNMDYRDSMTSYVEDIEQMEDQTIKRHFADAQSYNESLTGNVILTDPFDQEAYELIGEGYEKVIDVDGKGLIGYVEIPKINVYLPISHGTGEDVLEKGAGHLQNTSFPIGGESTHSVISAHTGFPGKSFFDYLTDLVIGDEFYIHVLNRTLKYEVDEITVIWPTETENLRIRTGEDHVTLLTCTPYGINSHRLLVRGKRVEYTPQSMETEYKPVTMDKSCMYVLGYKIPYWVAGCVIGAVVFIVTVITVVLTVRYRRKQENKNRVATSSSEEV